MFELVVATGFASAILPVARRVQLANQQPLALPQIDNLDLREVVRRRNPVHR